MNNGNERTVSVVEIVEEVKKNIEECGFSDDILSFDDIDYNKAYSLLRMEDAYDRIDLNYRMATLRNDIDMGKEDPLTGGLLGRSARRLLRKIRRVMVVKTVENQCSYNTNACLVLMQLISRTDIQEREIEKLQTRISELEKQLQG